MESNLAGKLAPSIKRNTEIEMPACTRRTTRKYTSRPSPPFSAQDCKGLVKKGSDGQDYVSKPDTRGIYRWTRKAGAGMGAVAPKGRKYLTHDNGGRPFAVYDDGKKVVVFRQTYNKETGKDEPTKTCFTSAYKHIWVGKDPLEITYKWDSSMIGNSIVIQTAANNYVFIGDQIYSFALNPGDSIVKYVSPVGNNDVPYPYIIGDKFVYLLLEKKVLPLEALDLKIDAYAQYYGHEKALVDVAKNLRTKLIEKRAAA